MPRQHASEKWGGGLPGGGGGGLIYVVGEGKEGEEQEFPLSRRGDARGVRSREGIRQTVGKKKEMERQRVSRTWIGTFRRKSARGTVQKNMFETVAWWVEDDFFLILAQIPRSVGENQNPGKGWCWWFARAVWVRWGGSV